MSYNSAVGLWDLVSIMCYDNLKLSILFSAPIIHTGFTEKCIIHLRNFKKWNKILLVASNSLKHPLVEHQSCAGARLSAVHCNRTQNANRLLAVKPQKWGTSHRYMSHITAQMTGASLYSFPVITSPNTFVLFSWFWTNLQKVLI